MQAKNVMTRYVLSVTPDTDVIDVARLMADNGISAVPVTDDDDRLVGIVSEGDLLHRQETGTERRRSWWLNLFSEPAQNAADYVKSHGRRVSDVMTRGVITVAEDTPLGEVAELLEKRHIKRVPVVRDDRPVGIVSRANIVQALAVIGSRPSRPVDQRDREVRDDLLSSLRDHVKLSTSTLNVIVEDGVAHLWGLVNDDEEKRAVEVAAENQPGVKRVESRIGLMADVLKVGGV